MIYMKKDAAQTCAASFFTVMLFSFAFSGSAFLAKGRRAKFCGGKSHGAEDTAGIILFGTNTCLVGNTVFGSLYQILTGTYQTHDREETKRYYKVAVAVIVIHNSAAKAALHVLGNIAHTAAAAATAAVSFGFHHVGVKHNGLHRLHHSGRNTARWAAESGNSAVIVGIAGAAEHINVALAPPKYNFFLYDSNSLKFLCTVASNTGFKGKLYIKTDHNLIETTIEADRVNGDVSPGNACILHTNISSPIKHIPTEIGQLHAHILKAVAVTAGIENTVCFNADHFSFPTTHIGCTSAGASVFSHI